MNITPSPYDSLILLPFKFTYTPNSIAKKINPTTLWISITECMRIYKFKPTFEKHQPSGELIW